MSAEPGFRSSLVGESISRYISGRRFNIQLPAWGWLLRAQPRGFKGGSRRILEPYPLNPDLDPVFWWIHLQLGTYPGGGFIAAFGSQLEDDVFEHSIEDLKVGAGGLPSPLNPDLDPVFLVNPSRYVSGRRFYCNIRSQLEDDFFEHSLSRIWRWEQEDYDNLNQCFSLLVHWIRIRIQSSWWIQLRARVLLQNLASYRSLRTFSSNTASWIWRWEH